MHLTGWISKRRWRHINDSQIAANHVTAYDIMSTSSASYYELYIYIARYIPRTAYYHVLSFVLPDSQVVVMCRYFVLEFD